MIRRNFLKGLIGAPFLGFMKKSKKLHLQGCEFCGSVTEILYVIPKNRPKPGFNKWRKIHTVSCIPCLQKILNGHKEKTVDYGLREGEVFRSEITTTSKGT